MADTFSSIFLCMTIWLNLSPFLSFDVELPYSVDVKFQERMPCFMFQTRQAPTEQSLVGICTIPMNPS